MAVTLDCCPSPGHVLCSAAEPETPSRFLEPPSSAPVTPPTSEDSKSNPCPQLSATTTISWDRLPVPVSLSRKPGQSARGPQTCNACCPASENSSYTLLLSQLLRARALLTASSLLRLEAEVFPLLLLIHRSVHLQIVFGCIKLSLSF